MDASAVMPQPRVDEAPADALRDALVEAVGADYEIVRLIGRGGMGAVYLARDKALERLVAIKVLPPAGADAGVLERFRREAKTVASLQHVGIVPLYAFGERRGLCWFVMGYVRGESLATRLEREQVMDVDTARTLLSQVADALDHAHRQGVVHRDIKPDNILLDDGTGRAMLTDFGIARADTMSSGTNLTQVGSVMGTPHFMSPEQATAEPTIDGRSDLYSVGVVGYQMLSGQLPFNGSSFRELLMQHVSATPKPLSVIAPQVPPDVSDAVMRCLEKDVSRRFADGRSLRTALGGQSHDDESLGYELAEFKHLVSYFVLTTIVSITIAVSSAVREVPFFGKSSLIWLLIPALFLSYGTRVREARQRGFEWKTIWRVMTLPPHWWPFWWPRSWRRSGDVYDRLPPLVKSARFAYMLMYTLLFIEAPLMTWATDAPRFALRDLVPPTHAWYALRWLANMQVLTVLLLLIAFLITLMGVGLGMQWLSGRAGKPHGLTRLDSRRLAHKATDAPFWRDPRIQKVLRGNRTEQKPTTPQEFVSQILASTGRLTPVSGSVSAESPTAARRLQDAIVATDREIALLEKAAPREQLDRLEAELVLMESDGGDPESIELLQGQRTALLRSRERMQVLHSRRDAALGELETLWAEVRKLAVSSDPAQLRELAERISARCKAVERDFPPRRGRTTTMSGTAAAVLVAALAGGLTLTAQGGAVDLTTVRALLQREQPDSALVTLDAAPRASAEAHTLAGLAHLQRGHERDIPLRVNSARAALREFTAAVARDSTDVHALESLAWIRRLLPTFLGGDVAEAERVVDRLEVVSSYRAQLLRGYFARLEKRSAEADSLFRNLTVTAPDSAGAWFALGESAFDGGRSDEARTAWQRYRTLVPDDRNVLYALGKLSAEHGVALQEGEAALRTYLQMPPLLTQVGADVAWWRLGQVLEKQGRVADARAAYQKAVALDGKDADFRASLEALQAASAPR
jgi:tetratricopeptide (TPR) repeat protein